MVFSYLWQYGFLKVLVYLSGATYTMNLQNLKSSKLPSLDFTNPREPLGVMLGRLQKNKTTCKFDI